MGGAAQGDGREHGQSRNGKGSAAVTSGAPSSRTRYVRRPRPSFDCVGRRRLPHRHVRTTERFVGAQAPSTQPWRSVQATNQICRSSSLDIHCDSQREIVLCST
jgi:hypothetical protein